MNFLVLVTRTLGLVRAVILNNGLKCEAAFLFKWLDKAEVRSDKMIRSWYVGFLLRYLM